MRDEQFLCTGRAKGHGGRCGRYALRGSDRCKAHQRADADLVADLGDDGGDTVKIVRVFKRIGGNAAQAVDWPSLNFTYDSLLAEMGVSGFERK